MQVADLYGIRACLLDGGEIRGAGNAWICPEVLLLRSVLLFQSAILLCLSQTNFFLLLPWWLQFVANHLIVVHCTLYTLEKKSEQFWIMMNR